MTFWIRIWSILEYSTVKNSHLPFHVFLFAIVIVHMFFHPLSFVKTSPLCRGHPLQLQVARWISMPANFGFTQVCRLHCERKKSGDTEILCSCFLGELLNNILKQHLKVTVFNNTFPKKCFWRIPTFFGGKDALPGFCATLWYQPNIHPNISMVDQDGSKLNRSLTESDTSRFLGHGHPSVRYWPLTELESWCSLFRDVSRCLHPLIHKSHKPIQPTTPGSLRMFSTDWTPLTAAVFAGKEAVVKAPLQP